MLNQFTVQFRSSERQHYFIQYLQHFFTIERIIMMLLQIALFNQNLNHLINKMEEKEEREVQQRAQGGLNRDHSKHQFKRKPSSLKLRTESSKQQQSKLSMYNQQNEALKNKTLMSQISKQHLKIKSSTSNILSYLQEQNFLKKKIEAVKNKIEGLQDFLNQAQANRQLMFKQLSQPQLKFYEAQRKIRVEYQTNIQKKCQDQLQNIYKLYRKRIQQESEFILRQKKEIINQFLEQQSKIIVNIVPQQYNSQEIELQKSEFLRKQSQIDPASLNQILNEKQCEINNQKKTYSEKMELMIKIKQIEGLIQIYNLRFGIFEKVFNRIWYINSQHRQEQLTEIKQKLRGAIDNINNIFDEMVAENPNSPLQIKSLSQIKERQQEQIQILRLSTLKFQQSAKIIIGILKRNIQSKDQELQSYSLEQEKLGKFIKQLRDSTQQEKKQFEEIQQKQEKIKDKQRSLKSQLSRKKKKFQEKMNKLNTELIKKNQSVEDFSFIVNNYIKQIKATTFANLGQLIQNLCLSTISKDIIKRAIEKASTSLLEEDKKIKKQLQHMKRKKGASNSEKFVMVKSSDMQINDCKWKIKWHQKNFAHFQKKLNERRELRIKEKNYTAQLQKEKAHLEQMKNQKEIAEEDLQKIRKTLIILQDEIEKEKIKIKQSQRQ